MAAKKKRAGKKTKTAPATEGQKAPSKKVRKAAPRKAASKKAAPKKAASKKAAPKKRKSATASPKRSAKKRRTTRSRSGASTKKRAVLQGPVIARQASLPPEPAPTPTPEVQTDAPFTQASRRTSSPPPSVKEAIDSYMDGLPRGALGTHLRKILTSAASGVDEAIKWAHADYQDPNGILHGASEKVRQVRRLIKLD